MENRSHQGDEVKKPCTARLIELRDTVSMEKSLETFFVM